MFKRPPLPIHWVHRGEIACGIAYRAETSRRRTTTDPKGVTCAKCIAVQFAMVGAIDLRGCDPDTIWAIQSHLVAAPKKGWKATAIKHAWLRAKGRP